MEFTQREFQIINDQEFLLTKASALSKVQSILELTKLELEPIVQRIGSRFHRLKDFSKGKISRGENYRGLPYLILDYPATFSNDDIFAFRTMFWWGNFFSCTLHLQGKSLERYRACIIDKFDDLRSIKDVFLSVGSTPWEYHYDDDNYKPLSQGDVNLIKQSSFLRLSKRFEISQWVDLPILSATFLSQLIKIMEMK